MQFLTMRSSDSCPGSSKNTIQKDIFTLLALEKTEKIRNQTPIQIKSNEILSNKTVEIFLKVSKFLACGFKGTQR